MKKISALCLTIFLSLGLSIGDNAPTFDLKGSPKNVDLKKLKGKFIVLEWFNDGCPFVRKHYDSGNMQSLQKKYKEKVVWLTINSSAPGRQGYLKDLSVAKAMYKNENMFSSSLLLDKGGKTGMDYRAKTTPHMYIINPKGKIIYQGAIDSIPSADRMDIKMSKNYVSMALDQALGDKEVIVKKTRPYGCSVKY